MKIVRYEKEGMTAYGVLEDGKIKRVNGDIFGEIETTDIVDLPEEVKILAPVEPSKVIGMGINYSDFCERMNIPKPEFPYIFLKAPTSVTGPEEPICYPKDDIANYEAEIAVVIADDCKNVSEEDALNHVLGYTICNDMTDRTDLLRDNHMGCAKNYDTFLPLGPVIETEYDWRNKNIRLTQNGEVKIDGNTNSMIFDIPCQIAFISRHMALKKGDVILSGSPAGASPVKDGDVIEITVEGIGTLKNGVKAI